MTRVFATADAVVRGALGRVFPAVQIEVRQGGKTVFSCADGWLDPETWQRPTRPDTLFDLASVTKLFVVTAFMTLVEAGLAGLDQPVCTVLPEFSGIRPIRPYEDPLKPGAFVAVEAIPASGGVPGTVDASRVTFRNLLAHNSGLPAWRPLFRLASLEAARRVALTSFFSYPTGARVIYSDIGLILLGMSVERLTGLQLDEAVQCCVTDPIGLRATGYLPIIEEDREGAAAQANIAPTEICAWRRRRITGEVHDENAARLGGIAGHAGLFSTASDVAALGQSFLEQDMLAGNRASQVGPATPGETSVRPVLAPGTIAEMVRPQAEDGMTRRGLGFALWSADPEASGNPFSEQAFGHTGFTGTSLWIDPERSLVVACLTNRVYYGRDASGILAFRVALHRALVEALAQEIPS
jgi:CubicO group peptidase (beta-lactamase class C family)